VGNGPGATDIAQAKRRANKMAWATKVAVKTRPRTMLQKRPVRATPREENRRRSTEVGEAGEDVEVT